MVYSSNDCTYAHFPDSRIRPNVGLAVGFTKGSLGDCLDACDENPTCAGVFRFDHSFCHFYATGYAIIPTVPSHQVYSRRSSECYPVTLSRAILLSK